MSPQIVYDQDGKAIKLDRKLGEGGEGSIYGIAGSSEYCAKIYKPERLSTEARTAKREKTLAMVRNPPDDPTWITQKHHSIAWPAAAYFEDARFSRFCGFSMPLLDLSKFQQSQMFYECEDRKNAFGYGVTWQHLLTAACNLSSAVAAIHAKKHCVGDLREQNILVAPNALVALIDCDSFQVSDAKTGRRFYTPVGTPEYLPPELLIPGVDFSRQNIDRYDSDLFGLSILIFKFLMDGCEPYAAVGSLVDDAHETTAKIRKGYFAYPGQIRGLKPPDYAPQYDLVPPAVRDAFYACFVDGHKDPKRRPKAEQWFKLLDVERSKVLACKMSASHFYSGHLRRCPWCEAAASTCTDPFPAPVQLGQQIALTEPVGSAPIEDRIAYLRTQMTALLADGIFAPSEKQYVGDLGLRLQIPKKQIDQIVKEELKKSQATVGASSGGGMPILEVSPQKIDAGQVPPGSSSAHSLVVSNGGGGTLTGTITATKKCIRLSHDTIDPSRHRQILNVEVNVVGLPEGYADTARININSNGGTSTIPVTFSVTLPYELRDRFRLVTTTVGVLAGGVLGCSAHLLFATMHRGARTLDFLAITWILAGTVGAFTYGYRQRRRWPLLLALWFGLIGFVGSSIGFAILQGVVKWFTSPGAKFATFVAAIAVGWLAWVSIESGILRYIHRRRIWTVGAISLCAAILLLTIPQVSSRDEIVAAARRTNPIPSASVSSPNPVEPTVSIEDQIKSAAANGDWNEAAKLSRQFLWVQSSAPEIEAIYRQAAYHQALDSFRRFQAQGDLDRAFNYAEHAVRLNPGDADAADALRSARAAISAARNYFGQHFVAVAHFTLPFGNVYSVVPSDDGRFLAASGQQGTVIYDLNDHTARATVRTWRLRFSPSTDNYVYNGSRGLIQAVELAHDAAIWSVAGSDAVGVIGPLGFSPDGKTVVCSTHQDLKILNYVDGQIIADVPIGYTNVRWGGFSSDGGLVGFAYDQKCVIYDKKQNEVVKTFNGAPYNCAFGPRNQFAFSTRDRISIVDANSWNETTAIPAAGDVAFSKDGRMLVVSKPGFINGQTVSLWDAATGRQIMQGVDNTEYALSPDGTLFCSVNGGSPIQVRQTNSGLILKNITTHESVRSLALTPDGKLVVGESAGEIDVLGNQTWPSGDTNIRALTPWSIRDEGNFFSENARRSANAEIADLHAKFGVDIVIETFQSLPQNLPVNYDSSQSNQFFASWMGDIERETGRQGIFLLACRSPSRFQWYASHSILESAFPQSDFNKLGIQLNEFIRAGDNDRMLAQFLSTIRQTLAENDAPVSTAQNESASAKANNADPVLRLAIPPSGDLGQPPTSSLLGHNSANQAGNEDQQGIVRTPEISQSQSNSLTSINGNSTSSLVASRQQDASNTHAPASGVAEEEKVALLAGWDALQKNQLDSALDAFQRAVKLNPSQSATDGIAKTMQAMFELGERYQQGTGIPKDSASAFGWYEKAANLGHLEAQKRLAQMYAHGDGVQLDQTQSTLWWHRAAEQNDPESQLELGQRYLSGNGTDRDRDDASHWFQAAAVGFQRRADAGDALAAETLGDMYYSGEGVERSYPDARHYYEIDSSPRTSSGQRNLGKIYLNGMKVKADRRKGISLLQAAARQGDLEAQRLLKNEGETW